MMIMMSRSMMTDRGMAVTPSPHRTRMLWIGLLEVVVVEVVQQKTLKGPREVAARVSPGRWTPPRSRNRVAAVPPQRKNHARGGHARVLEAREGQGVEGVQDHAPDPTALGEDISATFTFSFISVRQLIIEGLASYITF